MAPPPLVAHVSAAGKAVVRGKPVSGRVWKAVEVRYAAGTVLLTAAPRAANRFCVLILPARRPSRAPPSPSLARSPRASLKRRANVRVLTPQLRTPYQKRVEQERALRALRDQQQALLDAKKQAKLDERKRREDQEKRRIENARKSEVTQLVRPPARPCVPRPLAPASPARPLLRPPPSSWV